MEMINIFLNRRKLIKSKLLLKAIKNKIFLEINLRFFFARKSFKCNIRCIYVPKWKNKILKQNAKD